MLTDSWYDKKGVLMGDAMASRVPGTEFRVHDLLGTSLAGL